MAVLHGLATVLLAVILKQRLRSGIQVPAKQAVGYFDTICSLLVNFTARHLKTGNLLKGACSVLESNQKYPFLFCYVKASVRTQNYGTRVQRTLATRFRKRVCALSVLKFRFFYAKNNQQILYGL